MEHITNGTGDDSMKLKANNNSTKRIANTEDIISEFLTECKLKNLSNDTIQTYSVNIKYLMKYLAEKKIPLAEVTTNSIKDYNLYLIEQGNRNTTSINTLLRNIKVFLSWTYQNGYTDEVQVKYLKVKQEPKHIYSDEDIKILLKKPKLSDTTYTEFRTYCIINVLVSTGMRRSSLLNIKLEDIQWSKQLIKLSHTKNKQVHYVSMNSKLSSVLKEWLKYRVGDDTDYLFTTQTGEKLSPITITSSISTYNRSRGIEITSVHSFRHYYATKLVESGVDVYTVSKLLGHSNLEITQNYLRSLNMECFIKTNHIDIFKLLE